MVSWLVCWLVSWLVRWLVCPFISKAFVNVDEKIIGGGRSREDKEGAKTGRSNKEKGATRRKEQGGGRGNKEEGATRKVKN